VLAVLAAAAMIAGAVAVRSRIDDGGGGVAAGRLTCAPELEPVCETLRQESDGGLTVVIEPAGLTADRLASASGDPGLDGWLVTSAWPEIVDARRRARALPPLFGSPGEPLARSPLVLVTWKDRAAVLAPRCPATTVDWRCLGEAAGVPGGWSALGGQAAWGPVKPGHGRPSTDEVGLLVLGQAASSYFGRDDLSTVDLDDDGFRRWFGALERSVPQAAGSPLAVMLAAGPAAYDAVGTVEADAAPLVERSSRRASLEVLYPSPMATADLILATPQADAGARLRRALTGQARRELAASGWRVEGEPLAGGLDRSVELPPGDGLPDPGLLDALRVRWEEETGR
jgi:hypothetical protein